jgi:hypothetical protein
LEGIEFGGAPRGNPRREQSSERENGGRDRECERIGRTDFEENRADNFPGSKGEQQSDRETGGDRETGRFPKLAKTRNENPGSYQFWLEGVSVKRRSLIGV